MNSIKLYSISFYFYNECLNMHCCMSSSAWHLWSIMKELLTDIAIAILLWQHLLQLISMIWDCLHIRYCKFHLLTRGHVFANKIMAINHRFSLYNYSYMYNVVFVVREWGWHGVIAKFYFLKDWASYLAISFKPKQGRCQINACALLVSNSLSSCCSYIINRHWDRGHIHPVAIVSWIVMTSN